MQQKASVAHSMLEPMRERIDADALSPPVAKLVQDPPPPVWIPFTWRF